MRTSKKLGLSATPLSASKAPHARAPTQEKPPAGVVAVEEGKSGRRRYSGRAAAAPGRGGAEGQRRREKYKAAQVRDAQDEHDTEAEAAAAPATCADAGCMGEQESKEKTLKKRGRGGPSSKVRGRPWSKVERPARPWLPKVCERSSLGTH